MSYRKNVRFLDNSTPPHIATLIAMTGLGALAMNIFLPSLPGMTVYFVTEYAVIQLAIGLYLAVNGVLQLFVGSLSDRYGRRPLMITGLFIFLIATLGCIYAPNIYIFLIFRMMQAGIVVSLVLSRAVVRDVVPGEQAASMIGYITMGMALVPMIGPAIGGVLEEVFDWRANFWLVFGMGLLVLWLVWKDLGETAPMRGRSFRDQVREYPALLKSPVFWGYALATAFASGSFFAYLGGAPFVGQMIFHLSPAVLGIFFGVPATGYLAGNFLSGRFSVRAGGDNMVLWGAMINAGGIGLNLFLELLGMSTPLTFFGLMALMGLGNGMAIPNATAGALSVRPSLAGSASGLSGFLMVGGGAALSALAGFVLVSDASAAPLLWVMFASGIFSLLAIIAVFRAKK